MPQPLDSSAGNSLYGPDGELLLQRPDLAIHIAVIAGLWTEADLEPGHILANLLGQHARPVIAIYNALVSAAAKIDAVLAVATLKLNQEKLKTLDALLKEYRTRSGERNSVVHGTWVISDDFPDALVLINPNAFLKWSTDLTSIASFDELMEHPSSPHGALVYRLKDFLDIENRIKELKTKLTDFGLPSSLLSQWPP